MTTVAKPNPRADGLSRPYWDGSARGELLLQRCVACRKVRHYPQHLCPECHSDTYDWIVSPGMGVVHSWTVTHHAFLPAFATELPYALVTVDLDEGVRALGRWAQGTAVELAIGLPVVAGFVMRADGFGDLTFRPR